MIAEKLAALALPSLGKAASVLALLLPAFSPPRPGPAAAPEARAPAAYAGPVAEPLFEPADPAAALDLLEHIEARAPWLAAHAELAEAAGAAARAAALHHRAAAEIDELARELAAIAALLTPARRAA